MSATHVPKLVPTRGETAAPTPASAVELKRQYDFRQTVLPPCLLLSGSAFIMAAAWFALDPASVLRANPVGIGLPIGLLIAAFTFGALAVVFARQAASMARALQAGEV